MKVQAVLKIYRKINKRDDSLRVGVSSPIYRMGGKRPTTKGVN